MLQLRTQLIGLLLLLSHCVVASGTTDSPQIECSASVLPGSAAFAIQNLEGNEEWKWHKASSADGLLEYEWSVTLGEFSSDGNFKSNGKRFGFSLFKWNSMSEVSGSLFALFRYYGQNDVWTESDGEHGPKYTRVEGARVKAGIYKNSVLLGVTDPSTFKLLFKERPKAAYLSAHLPAINKNYSCVIEIQYE
jgi:hypothetical protein